ncbi:FAD/NAD(P)-binding domain-containing protein [Serendipita vermifera]|nr:FAD/NAD(P)-binding domain-containing protein [Serendipita vermifera]
MSDKTSIVILGAGGAGIATAKALDAKLDPARHTLTVVTSADYFFHLPAALRTVVTAEGDLEDQMCIPYDTTFGKTFKQGNGRLATFQFGNVIGVEEKDEGGVVHLEGGRSLSWDFLVIATGSQWNGPLRWPKEKENVKPYLDDWREKFATAKSVVIVGGGAVGTELAGEVREFYPSTELTLVQKNPLLLNSTYPDSFRHRVHDGLTSRGVKVITGDTVENLSADILNGIDPVTPGRKITTAKGATVPAELIVSVNGRRGVNTSFLDSTHSPSAPSINKALESSGHLQVNPSLQLTTNPHVFAAGDVVALPEQHTLIKASAHAGIVAGNILVLLQAKDKRPATKPYRKAMDSILITNGRTRGSTYFDFFTVFGRPIIFGDWFSSVLKSKGLLIGMARGILNQ